MLAETLTSASSGPALEAISQTIGIILDFAYAVRDVLVKKRSFKELAA